MGIDTEEDKQSPEMKPPLGKLSQALQESQQYPLQDGDGRVASAGKNSSVEFKSSRVPVSLGFAHTAAFQFSILHPFLRYAACLGI